MEMGWQPSRVPAKSATVRVLFPAVPVHPDAMLLDIPPLLFVLSVLVLWASMRLGDRMRRTHVRDGGERADLELVRGATLTLLGLIVGFSFSMAVQRYDSRKTFEEGEANAIGTASVRTDFLPEAEAAPARALLKDYVGLRMAWYATRDGSRLADIDRQVLALQDRLWATAREAAAARPTPITALYAAGINDVLNAQGYTQAAWWNRLPFGAWALMFVMAISAHGLVGYSAHQGGRLMLTVLPLTTALAFFLIADIDSPRGGMIRVTPQNLVSLHASMKP